MSEIVKPHLPVERALAIGAKAQFLAELALPVCLLGDGDGGKADLVAVVGGVPVPPAGCCDRGEGGAAEIPVDLARYAIAVHVGAEAAIGIDLAIERREGQRCVARPGDALGEVVGDDGAIVIRTELADQRLDAAFRARLRQVADDADFEGVRRPQQQLSAQ
nr:hypothetical protein [Sandaracinobacteroides hominis]